MHSVAPDILERPEWVRAKSRPSGPNQTVSTGPVAGDARRSSTAGVPTRRHATFWAAAEAASTSGSNAYRTAARCVAL